MYFWMGEISLSSEHARSLARRLRETGARTKGIKQKRPHAYEQRSAALDAGARAPSEPRGGAAARRCSRGSPGPPPRSPTEAIPLSGDHILPPPLPLPLFPLTTAVCRLPLSGSYAAIPRTARLPASSKAPSLSSRSSPAKRWKPARSWRQGGLRGPGAPLEGRRRLSKRVRVCHNGFRGYPRAVTGGAQDG